MIFYNVRIPIYQVYLQMARLLQIDNLDENLWQFEVSENVLITENQKKTTWSATST